MLLLPFMDPYDTHLNDASPLRCHVITVQAVLRDAVISPS